MRVALVHDWLVSYRGGEKVLHALCQMFPNAPIFTLFYAPRRMPDFLRTRDVRVPRVLNSLRPFRKALLPILPRAIEAVDLRGFDLIVSTSSCVAKGAQTANNAKHICYLHSPMRYIWDQREQYLGKFDAIPGVAQIIDGLVDRLRAWDVDSAQRVDRFIVNSTFVGERVRQIYRREDFAIVHPPVAIERFAKNAKPWHERGNYFLAAGALVSYKRFDLAIQACEAAKKPLLVAGAGPSRAALQKIAGPMTRFVDAPTDAEMVQLMQGARALLFPGIEDFGITAVEALASGTPVIARGAGGALDYIVDGTNGAFFHSPDVDVLAGMLTTHRPEDYDMSRIMRSAAAFTPEAFIKHMEREILSVTGSDPLPQQASEGGI